MVIQKSLNKDLLKPDQLIVYKIPEKDAVLPEKIIEKIIKKIFDYHCSINTVYNSFGFQEILAGIEWTRSTEKGSLAKRIGKWCYERNLKLSDNLLNEIGQIIASKDSAPAIEESYFSFSNSLDWNQGDFGDSGSCFWGCNSIARDHINSSENFLSVKFYRKVRSNPFADSGGKKYFQDGPIYYLGYGRAIIYSQTFSKQINKDTKIEGDGIVVFNAYGLKLNHLTTILSSYLGSPFKEVKVTNNEKRTGKLYLNSSAYLIADQAILDQIESIDLEQPVEQKKAVPLRPFGVMGALAADMGRLTEVRTEVFRAFVAGPPIGWGQVA